MNISFFEIDEFGEIRIHVLGIIFVTKEDIGELCRLAMKPFPREAMRGRLRDLMQERFCEVKPLSKNFLPHVMRSMLQMVYVGASVNHSLHRYVCNTFQSNLLLHQLERRGVHAFRMEPFVKDALAMVGVKGFWKQGALGDGECNRQH